MSNQDGAGKPPAQWSKLGQAIPTQFGGLDEQTKTYRAGPATQQGLPGVNYRTPAQEQGESEAYAARVQRWAEHCQKHGALGSEMRSWYAARGVDVPDWFERGS